MTAEHIKVKSYPRSTYQVVADESKLNVTKGDLLTLYENGNYVRCDDAIGLMCSDFQEFIPVYPDLTVTNDYPC